MTMPKTYNDIYLQARRALRASGIAAYSLEARLLTAFAAGKSLESFMRDLRLYTSDAVAKRADELIARRLRGEPIAYITGEWEFFGIPLTITEDVLIPRIDTEVLVETAVTALKRRKMDARVLDLCAGSGCVGCAIAKELPATSVVLVDNDASALFVARQNIVRHKLEQRVSCVETCALADPPLMLGIFDILVCNPPYIPTAKLADLDDSVKLYEPHRALDGGDDGLDFYRAILEKWCTVVRSGGLMMFEAGEGQAEDIIMLMRIQGLRNIGSVKDTLGIDRVIFGNVK